MKTVIIDNYDSFTYNLAHLVKELGAEVDVLRNDKFELEELEKYDKIILSPGPGIPEEAGLLLEVIRTYAGRKPILGVCLGEQAIGQAFGGKLTNLSEVFHGIQTNIVIRDEGLVISDELLITNHSSLITDYIFSGLPTEISLLGSGYGRISRRIGYHCHQLRRSNHGTETSGIRCSRHPISPGIGTDSRWKTDCRQLAERRLKCHIS